MEKVFKSQKMERREITIGEARPLLTETEMEKHLNSDQITKDAIEVCFLLVGIKSIDQYSICDGMTIVTLLSSGGNIFVEQL